MVNFSLFVIWKQEKTGYTYFRAQSWESIYKDTVPYPNKQFKDLTQEKVDQNYTALKMFKMAEHFYVSLNMSALPPYVFFLQSIRLL